MEELNEKNKYFVMIPYWIIDNLSVNPMGLYITMKRATGEAPTGECYLSEKTLMKKLKIGKKALKGSLSILISNNLIYKLGKREILTSGGPQRVMFYGIVDIWTLNKRFYEGIPKRTPLYTKGSLKSSQRAMLTRDKEELNKEEKIITPEEREKIETTKKEIRKILRLEGA